MGFARPRDDNVEIVRRIYAEWEQGNLAAAVELFDPEIVFESFMPDSRERIVARGREEVEAFTRDFLLETRDYRMIGEEFLEVGNDKVFVAGRQATIGRRSGVPVDGPAFWVWTFRGGKVARLLFETDGRKAREAAGLSE
jgi:ketosteroid isomerase-like protein